MTTGSLTAGVGGEVIGDFGQSGSFIQAGGTNMSQGIAVGVGRGASGSYTLTGGYVSPEGNPETLGFGGAGTFTQSGGTNAASDLDVGATSPGSYTLSGSGVLSSVDEFIGGSVGTFSQSGGINFVSGGLHVGVSNVGTYTLYAGSLSAGSETVDGGGGSYFTQSAGTNTTPVLSLGYYPSGVGSYSLSGAGVLKVTTSECIGYSGTGSFAQSAGTHTAPLLYLGYNAGSVGSYNLIAGSVVTSGPVIVGNSGYGTFTQVAGSNTNHGILLAAASGSYGTYNLCGSGVLNSLDDDGIGVMGTGSFTQSAGTNSTFDLVLGVYRGSSGTYNLNGGLLSVFNLFQGGGTGSFNFSGGTLQATSSFATSVPINLTGLGSNAIFDTNGNTLTLDGGLSGQGGFQKIGQGALVLTTANYIGGPVTMDAGVLVAANSNSGSATGNYELLLNGGILSAGSLGGTILAPVQAGGGPHTIAPGYGLAAEQYGTLNLRQGLTTNPYTTLLYKFNSGSLLGTGSNGYDIYGGDLINLGGSSLTVGGGTIASVMTLSTSGDYRLFANPGSISGLTNFSLPGQLGIQCALSTTADSGYIDLVVTPYMTASGGTWISPASGSWFSTVDWSCQPAIPVGGTVYFPGAPPLPSRCGWTASRPPTRWCSTCPTATAIRWHRGAMAET